MNKKILLSLSVIGIAAAIAIGGTIAYFSDVETSTGNTFTAGSLDLIVDINGVVQNPLSDPIFTVPDMKPGDSGEKTISLTVDNNPACGFVNFNLTSDLDNSCTEPEAAEEGAGCPLNAPAGELNDNVVWTIWSDMGIHTATNSCEGTVIPGDNKYNPECGDVQLTTGNLVANKTWSIGELPVTPNHQYYGIAWQLPGAVTNIVQSDSFAADMIINALQKRNQYPNGCPAVGEIAQPVHVTSGTLHYGPTGWGGWSCPANTTVVNGSLVVTGGDLAQTFAWLPGATTGAVNYPNTPFGYTYVSGETGYIGQNDNDSGESIVLHFDCMPN